MIDAYAYRWCNIIWYWIGISSHASPGWCALFWGSDAQGGYCYIPRDDEGPASRGPRYRGYPSLSIGVAGASCSVSVIIGPHYIGTDQSPPPRGRECLSIGVPPSRGRFHSVVPAVLYNAIRYRGKMDRAPPFRMRFIFFTFSMQNKLLRWSVTVVIVCWFFFS